MDPAKAADFDDSLDTIARIRAMPSLVQKADALALELMPLVEAGIAEAVQLGVEELPGGPLLALGIHAIQPVIEERIRAWIQARAASFAAPPATPPAAAGS